MSKRGEKKSFLLVACLKITKVSALSKTSCIHKHTHRGVSKPAHVRELESSAETMLGEAFEASPVMVANVWQHFVAMVIDKTLTAPLQYSRIFPDGVRMMTDILFLALWKDSHHHHHKYECEQYNMV